MFCPFCSFGYKALGGGNPQCYFPNSNSEASQHGASQGHKVTEMREQQMILI